MGGAVFASLDGETNFATMPERVESTLRGAIGAHRRQARQPQERPPAAGRRVQRPRARSSASAPPPRSATARSCACARSCASPPTSTLTSTEFAASVPPFNAQKMLAQAGADGVPIDDQAGRRARRRSLLRDARSRRRSCRGPSSQARCRSTTSSRACATPPIGPAARSARYQVASLPPGGPAPLAYAADGTPDPYAGFETRIVPENITLLPKTGSQATGGNAWNERAVTVKKGESIATILKEIGATARRDRRDRIGARPARPQERAEGRPEASHPRRRHATARASGRSASS